MHELSRVLLTPRYNLVPIVPLPPNLPSPLPLYIGPILLCLLHPLCHPLPLPLHTPINGFGNFSSTCLLLWGRVLSMAPTACFWCPQHLHLHCMGTANSELTLPYHIGLCMRCPGSVPYLGCLLHSSHHHTSCPCCHCSCQDWLLVVLEPPPHFPTCRSLLLLSTQFPSPNDELPPAQFLTAPTLATSAPLLALNCRDVHVMASMALIAAQGRHEQETRRSDAISVFIHLEPVGDKSSWSIGSVFRAPCSSQLMSPEHR